MEAAGNPEVKCEIHNTQGLREGVQPHHIFIHQYFITRGQRWVVAVSQIFSPYGPPIRTHLPTNPYSTTLPETFVPPQMGIGKMAHPCLFLTCLWVGIIGGSLPVSPLVTRPS